MSACAYVCVCVRVCLCVCMCVHACVRDTYAATTEHTIINNTTDRNGSEDAGTARIIPEDPVLARELFHLEAKRAALTGLCGTQQHTYSVSKPRFLSSSVSFVLIDIHVRCACVQLKCKRK